MAKKEFSVITTLREALPRSKRRRSATQSGGGGGTINVVSSGGSDGDGHTHNNMAVLDAQSMDDDGYLYLRHRTDDAEESVTEKIKAGYADEAAHAKEADNADMWDKRQFDDFLDQPVRKTDSVQHKEVITDTLRGAGQFVDGLLGSGYRLWRDANGLIHLTIDKLTVRQTMVVLELLVERIRSVGGQIVVSAANGKIKTVEELEGYYRITFEQDNQFMVHDLVRCQVFANGALKGYWVEVADVQDNSILVPIDEFAGTPPEVGDECVLMGNSENTARQNLVLISATEDGQPRIDVMNGVNSKSFEDCLRARFGNLDGISDTMFPADKQPHGDGLYSDNAFLRGTFILANRNVDVETMFEITEGKIEAAVTGIRQDFLGENGYLNNAAFADGMDKWTTENETVFFLVGNKWIWANKNVLSKKGNSASVTTDNGRVVVRIRNKYILQKYDNLRVIPEMGVTSDGLKTALPVYLSFFYRCAEPGTLKVSFENVDKTGCVEFDSLNIEEQLQSTDGVYKQYTCSGLWNGTGDFKLSFTGDIYLYMLVLSTDKVEAFTYQYKTLLEQSERLVKISAAVYDKDEALLEETGLITTSKVTGMYAIDGEGNLKSFVGASQEGVKIKAAHIALEGVVTANNYFQILEDGSIVANKGTFNDVVINGSMRSPFVRETDSIDFTIEWMDGDSTSTTKNRSTHDNVVPIASGGGWITAGTLEWDAAQSGRRMCIANYKWKNSVTEGSISYSAPKDSGKYFFENGIAKSEISLSRECVELMGYGTEDDFYGWIVLNRIDLMTNARYGKEMKVLAFGRVTGGKSTETTSIQARTFDGSTLTVEWVSTGRYKVYVPSEWKLQDNNYMAVLTGYGFVEGSSKAATKATLLGAYSTYFEVFVSDDASANNGSFMFILTNLNDWMYL